MSNFWSAARVLCLAAMACAVVAPAQAQNYPNRPIHFVLPYQPGGIVDFTGRVLAQAAHDRDGTDCGS